MFVFIDVFVFLFVFVIVFMGGWGGCGGERDKRSCRSLATHLKGGMIWAFTIKLINICLRSITNHV